MQSSKTTLSITDNDSLVAPDQERGLWKANKSPAAIPQTPSIAKPNT